MVRETYLGRMVFFMAVISAVTVFSAYYKRSFSETVSSDQDRGVTNLIDL